MNCDRLIKILKGYAYIHNFELDVRVKNNVILGITSDNVPEDKRSGLSKIIKNMLAYDLSPQDFIRGVILATFSGVSITPLSEDVMLYSDNYSGARVGPLYHNNWPLLKPIMASLLRTELSNHNLAMILDVSKSADTTQIFKACFKTIETEKLC